MASPVMMVNESTGLSKNGYYGFSWTTLFFGPFPALFRSDFITFLGFIAVTVVLAVTTWTIGNVIADIAWAFMYNRYYTRKLIEHGYRFADKPEIVAEASRAVGIAMPVNAAGASQPTAPAGGGISGRVEPRF